MNKVRRSKIERIKERIESAIEDLQDILYEEEECYDNMPEGFKASERGETSENAIDIITDVIDAIQDATENLEEVLY